MVATEERQLAQQAAQRAAHGQVGFQHFAGGADLQSAAPDHDVHRQGWRVHGYLDAASLQRTQRGFGIGIQGEGVVERGFQRTAGERLEGIERRQVHAAILAAKPARPARPFARFMQARGGLDGVLPSRRRETVMRQTRLPRSSEMIARITNTTNSTHAMLVAAPAMPLKPSTAAIRAMTKKMMA